jgi:acid stress-induced BolA-like protein IbaG/YrbA
MAFILSKRKEKYQAAVNGNSDEHLIFFILVQQQVKYRTPIKNKQNIQVYLDFIINCNKITNVKIIDSLKKGRNLLCSL